MTSFLYMCMYKCEHLHICAHTYLHTHVQLTNTQKQRKRGRNRIFKITPQNTYTCTCTYKNSVSSRKVYDTPNMVETCKYQDLGGGSEKIRSSMSSLVSLGPTWASMRLCLIELLYSNIMKYRRIRECGMRWNR